MSPLRGDDDDLADLLSDLRATLDGLDRTLRDEERERDRGRDGPGDGDSEAQRASGSRGAPRPGDRRPASRSPGAGRRSRPRPPSAGELLRFTDEYTIPTVISLLEATIRSLELLRGVLRLVDPERSARPGGDGDRSRLPGPGSVARDEAARSVRRTLSELRTALSEADLPADAESRGIVEDARHLSAEIERRIAESERRRTDAGAAERAGSTRPSREEADDGGSVRIDVAEEGDGSGDGEGRSPSDDRTADADEGGAATEGSGDAVDVEAELRSIKDEVDGSRRPDAPDDPDDASGGDEGTADDR